MSLAKHELNINSELILILIHLGRHVVLHLTEVGGYVDSRLLISDWWLLEILKRTLKLDGSVDVLDESSSYRSV